MHCVAAGLSPQALAPQSCDSNFDIFKYIYFILSDLWISINSEAGPSVTNTHRQSHNGKVCVWLWLDQIPVVDSVHMGQIVVAALVQNVRTSAALHAAAWMHHYVWKYVITYEQVHIYIYLIVYTYIYVPLCCIDLYCTALKCRCCMCVCVLYFLHLLWWIACVQCTLCIVCIVCTYSTYCMSCVYSMYCLYCVVLYVMCCLALWCVVFYCIGACIIKYLCTHMYT